MEDVSETEDSDFDALPQAQSCNAMNIEIKTAVTRLGMKLDFIDLPPFHAQSKDKYPVFILALGALVRIQWKMRRLLKKYKHM